MSGMVATLPLSSPSSAPRSASEFFSDPFESHPLWFKPSLFLSPGFDSESYISELRTFVPFDTLRSQLRSHLASLNGELVDLINRDYADFVNLSTKLVDIDAAVIRMRAPLLELREKITGFRGSLEASLFSLSNGLHQRSDAAAAREVLDLLLNTFHVVSKVEKLIKVLPTAPSDWQNEGANSLGRSFMSDDIPTQQDGTTMRETQSMLLERIASEMNRLRFYMAHAQNLPFIENMEKSIQSASVLLDASLGHCFIDGLNNSDTSVIYNCLRAYAAIDNINNAEELFRTTTVAPFIHKIIAHETSADAAGASVDELENDYKQIKHFIAKDCKMLLEISSTDKSGLHVSNFLANSILKEVLSALQKVKPGVFSPGRPTQFLKNYKASLDFLTYLEGYCPSRSAVTKFRAEATCIEFMKQWNVGVYFSLRIQEIAGGLDSALTSASLVFIQDSDSDKPSSTNLMLRQSVTLLESLRSCWKDDVLVFSAADKFLRLTLQLLSRYCNWVSSVVNTTKSNASPSPGCEWAFSATAEDFVYVIHDVNCLVSEIRGNFPEHISHYLSSCSSEVLDVVRRSILEGGESLENVLPLVTNTIIEVIVDKSVEDLRQLRGIIATFMMPNKPLPVRHSPYVIGLLRPLKAFLEGEKARHYLTQETREELLLGTVTEISRRYYELAAELVSEARKRETVLQKHRQNAQRRAGAASGVSDQNVSETEKMCMQLFLDLQEYGRNISALGLNPADIPPYRSLWQCVAPADRQNTISV
ncbi:hypothetical protein CARUB_v10013037mg [Capsella rubella]|uniref:Conserved oligomeric Golgi complex subunit 2 n=1 Tax=Capsella rubella TaxID=81985 RepID=R0HZT3_9BRAS|nr:conserved oligomeric Golgi complex subunit 2 [Capsella rubella]EOA29583.1 hypothetical protein CARUB_v10013037mg [Capsella rubella]